MTNNEKQAILGETMPRNGRSRKRKAIEQTLRVLGFEYTNAIIKRWRKSKPPDDPGAISTINDFLFIGPGITADLEFIVVTDNCGIWALSAIQVKVVLNSVRSTEGFSILEQQFQVKIAPLPTCNQIIRQTTEWVVAEVRRERTYLLSALTPEFERLGFTDYTLFIWQPSASRTVGSFRYMQQLGENGETVEYSFTPEMEKESDTIVIASVTISLFRFCPDAYNHGSKVQKNYQKEDGPIPSRNMMLWQLLSKTIGSLKPYQHIKRSYAAGFRESRMAIANTKSLLARCQSNPNSLRQLTTIL